MSAFDHIITNKIKNDNPELLDLFNSISSKLSFNGASIQIEKECKMVYKITIKYI